MPKILLYLLLAVSLSGNFFLLYQGSDARLARGPAEEPIPALIEVPVPGTYPFIRVIDGNTVAIGYAGRTEHVRLLGIRVPEPNIQGGPECQTVEAIAHLRALTQTGTVVLSFDAMQGPRDNLNRLVGYVELPDGTDIAEAMLRDGFAREFSLADDYERSEQYKDAEQYAIENQLGLWDQELCP